MFRLENVTAGYGASIVLRDVSLAVPDGSVAALVGPNGAGKTTLLRVASGLMPPRRGRVTLDGTVLTGQASYQAAAQGVCHVPEGRGIFRSLTVRENLMLFSAAGTEGRGLERAVEAFPKLGQRLSQVAGTMSGGEQQMVALARAYIGSPRVILLDEVSMGLAPKLVDEIFVFLERLKAERISLLIVEQYVSRVLAIADYAYVLTRGTIDFAGDPSELEQEDVFGRYLGIAV
ncbi:MAG TPA: ABC transporter ATP-binding protein [Acidimicrobiia bacterium]|nr:ABC transporter ATP-binding protein [Acidimicrobiia bacterium]